MKTKPTMKDLAKACGVSWPTVSYVFNNSRPVSPKTRELVFSKAREIGYVPDVLARGLATKRSYTIGILFSGFNYSTSVPIFVAIEEAARLYNYRLVLGLQGAAPAAALADLQDLTARRMDGIIFVSATDNLDSTVIAALEAATIPILLAYTSPPDLASLDSILPDQTQGGLIATRHLLSRGRRKLAFIGASEDNNATGKRLAGFRLAHKELNLQVDPALIRFAGYSAVEGRKAALDIMQNDMPDGVFAADDNIAAGVLQACALKGVKVPQDLSVIGFDNSIICSVTLPQITSVAMPFGVIGQYCLDRLVYRLQNPDEWTPDQKLLACEIVHRETA